VADEAHERIHINAPIDVCFDLATDFEGYPAWTSDVKHARVVERDAQGRATRADFRAAALGRSVRYVLDYDLSAAPRSFSWQLVEGDMLRTLEGTYTFDDVDEGTDATYDLTVDLAIPLPGLVKRRAAGRIVGAALQDLKTAAEARAKAPDTDRTRSEPVVVVDPDPEPDPEGAPEPHPDGPSETPTDNRSEEDAVEDAPQGTHYDDVATEERSLPLPSSIEVVISELLGAVPEVRDHLLAAADELLDAAKAVLDAADRVVRQQREGSP
jgi:ribosome-associated toxin RatA of RatAB toxin-antitoxin module